MTRNESRQLEVIKLVSEHLTREHLEHWLWGGWAVDFWAGRVTRAHDDIDLLAWAADLERVRAALADLEIRDDELDPDKDSVRFTDGSVSIEVTAIERDDDRIVTRGRERDWTWPPGAFDRPRCRMGEVIAPVVSPPALLEVKLHLADHPAGRAPKDHDIHDMEALQRVIAAEPA